MDELKQVNHLVRKYKTNNPFIICDYLNIAMRHDDLGSFRGYYTEQRRIKYIVLNSFLEPPMDKIVCAHELGHAILHPKLNTPFFSENTLFSRNKFEMQANRFAAYLILLAYNGSDFYEMNMEQISVITGLPERYLELAIIQKVLKK